MKRIPKVYLDEFLLQQTALLKNRLQLVGILFVSTFLVGSIVGNFALRQHIGPTLAYLKY